MKFDFENGVGTLISIPSLIFGEKLSIKSAYALNFFFEFNQSTKIIRVR